MNVPFSLSAEVANNAWMRDKSDDERQIDRGKALQQFLELYQTICKSAIVYLLPSWPGLQDQTYVSNLGVVLPHLPQPTVVISRFRSEPRKGEAAVGCRFFNMMGYRVELLPAQVGTEGPRHGGALQSMGAAEEEVYFEGEADLKYLTGRVFIGAHGLRTSKKALQWFAEAFDMTVIPFLMAHERLYHLDCCVLPLSPDAVMICTAAVEPTTVREIEKYVEIIDVPLIAALYGATNCLVLDNRLIFSSDISELSRGHKDYEGEKAKLAYLDRACRTLSAESVMLNLSEFLKSGAMLSCLVMHLNYRNFFQSRLGKAPTNTPIRFQSDTAIREPS